MADKQVRRREDRGSDGDEDHRCERQRDEQQERSDQHHHEDQPWPEDEDHRGSCLGDDVDQGEDLVEPLPDAGGPDVRGMNAVHAASLAPAQGRSRPGESRVGSLVVVGAD